MRVADDRGGCHGFHHEHRFHAPYLLHLQLPGLLLCGLAGLAHQSMQRHRYATHVSLSEREGQREEEGGGLRMCVHLFVYAFRHAHVCLCVSVCTCVRACVLHARVFACMRACVGARAPTIPCWHVHVNVHVFILVAHMEAHTHAQSETDGQLNP
jgi:hypothetical protein